VAPAGIPRSNEDAEIVARGRRSGRRDRPPSAPVASWQERFGRAATRKILPHALNGGIRSSQERNFALNIPLAKPGGDREPGAPMLVPARKPVLTLDQGEGPGSAT
jgi:hypothetical protein